MSLQFIARCVMEEIQANPELWGRDLKNLQLPNEWWHYLVAMMALDQTAMPYYAARAKLIVRFASFTWQSSMLDLSANILSVWSAMTLLFVALNMIGRLQADPWLRGRDPKIFSLQWLMTLASYDDGAQPDCHVVLRSQGRIHRSLLQTELFASFVCKYTKCVKSDNWALRRARCDRKTSSGPLTVRERPKNHATPMIDDTSFFRWWRLVQLPFRNYMDRAGLCARFWWMLFFGCCDAALSLLWPCG